MDEIGTSTVIIIGVLCLGGITAFMISLCRIGASADEQMESFNQSKEEMK